MIVKKILYVAFILGSIALFSQVKKVESNTFDIDGIHEKDYRLSLVDDYNQYLTSYINTDGLMANSYPHKKILVRKLDQKGNFMELFVKDYANKTNGFLHNYLGSIEIGKDKIIFFTEEYSGQNKKKEIFQHIFNKKDSQFTTTSIATFSIESATKSGTTRLSFSPNGNYVAIYNDRFSNKKNPNINDVIVLDLKTINVFWKKEISLDNDFIESEICVTDSGRILVLQKANGWKLASKLELISNNEQKEIPVEEKYDLKKVFTFSIDDKDYAATIGKYNITASVKGEIWGDIFFHDLSSGTRTSGKINNMASDIDSFEIINTYSTNGNATVFGQAIIKQTPPETAYNRFPDPIYTYGEAFAFTFSKDGKISSYPLFNVGKFKISTFKRQSKYYVSGMFESKKTTFITNYEPIKIFDENSFSYSYIQLGDSKPLEDHASTNGNLIKFLPSVNRLIFLYNRESIMNMVSYYNLIQ